MEVQLADFTGGRMKKFERRINGLKRSSGGNTISDMQVDVKTNKYRICF
jgi:hypothetical protein